MGTEAPPTEIVAPEILTVRANGTLVHAGMAIGRIEASPNPGAPSRLVLNLGWLKAAEMGITILADPEVDHRRSGIILER